MRRALTGGERRGVAWGVAAIVAIVVGTYLAFGGSLPWQHEFTVKAVFRTANGIQQRSPVRIGGVNVGTVTDVQGLGGGHGAAVVTMELDRRGLPLHADATAKIRPRLFVEGNFFVDLRPGTPSAPTMHDGATIPIQRTATPVQLDQVLDALQHDTRGNLQTLLDQYSQGLARGGAAGYNASIPYWEPAYRNGSIVNQALLGTERRDLSRYLESAAATARALDREPARLKSLIADFATFAAALASQSDNLTRTVAELPRTLHVGIPALRGLDRALPPVRALAREARPGVRSSAPTIDASLPFLRQARALVSRAELRGLVADLRPTVPALARLNARTVPLLRLVRAASSCQNEVIQPWTHDRVPDPGFKPSGPVYQEGVKWLPGIAGESRSGDANGQWFRVLAGNGTSSLELPGGRIGIVPLPVEGSRPAPSLTDPPLRTDQPCELQDRPDLRTQTGAPPPQRTLGLDTPAAIARWQEATKLAVEWLEGSLDAEGLSSLLHVSSMPFQQGQLSQPGLGALGGGP